MYDLLLSPLEIEGLTLSNRIVMPPMVTFLAEDDGMVTHAHKDHYEQSSGPGLMIVEGTAVLPEGRIDKRQLGIYGDQHVEGLSQLAEAIHSNGAVAGIQIHHAGATAFAEARGAKPYRRIPPVHWPDSQCSSSGHRIWRESGTRSETLAGGPRRRASTSSNSTPPTDTCSASCSRHSRTGGSTSTAEASRTAAASSLRSSGPCRTRWPAGHW